MMLRIFRFILSHLPSKQEYKDMPPGEKLGFLGKLFAVLAVIGSVLWSVVSFLYHAYISAYNNWHPDVDSLLQKAKDVREKQTVYREFSILKGKNESISIDCPGDNCMKFVLDGLKSDEGLLWQTILFQGGGFHYSSIDWGEKAYAEWKDNMRLTGAVFQVFPPPGVEIGFREDSKVEIFMEKSTITIYPVSLVADDLSLAISVTVPPRVKPRYDVF